MLDRAIELCKAATPPARQTAAAFCLLAMTGASGAFAADGYLQNGVGARQKALAGAGVADSTDATAASLNPAGLVNVDNQVSVSISGFNQRGGYSSSGVGGVTNDGRHDSDAHWSAIPNIAANWRVNWGLVDAVGLTINGNGGAKTHYADVANAGCGVYGGGSGIFCGGRLALDMQQMFISAAFAKQIVPGLSVGIAPILARQTIDVDGVGLYSGFSLEPAHFSNQGRVESWGYGVRGGLEWKMAPGVRFGVAGNTRLAMDKFQAYRGLFAGGGGADIPATVQAGFAFDVLPQLTLLADYKHVWFNSVAAIGNASTNAAPFGSADGPGFGLQNIDVVKLGLEWRHSPDLTLRAGYSHNTAPLKGRDADLNIMTLGVVQDHFTGGLKYKLTEAVDLEFAAMYAPHASLTGPELGNPFRTVEIGNRQFEITVGAVYRFGPGPGPRSEPLK